MILSARQDPEALAEWLRYGGLATLDSYTRRGLGKGIAAVPETHWDFLEKQTLDYHETEERIYVHATVHPQLDMQEQPDYLLFWEPFSDPTMHKSGKQIVCGHKSQKTGRPALFRKGICIDTWVYGDGWLTCMDAGQKIFMQTNERGQRRMLDMRTLGTR
jgi:serine/threonine protein phosphatase 1